MGKSAVKPKRDRYPVKMGTMELPSSEADKKFCEAWIKTKDTGSAARAAGFAESSIRQGFAKKKLLRFLPYISQQLERREQVVAKQFVLDQKDIINEMMAIGFANAQDYVKVEERIDDKGAKIIARTQKPINELTRAQAAAISEVTFHPDGRVTYSLPDERSKYPYLKDLGQHLGLFHPTLIQEHRHAHIHRTLDLKNLDTDKLEDIERQLIEAMGDEANRVLGIIPGEFEEIDNQPAEK